MKKYLTIAFSCIAILTVIQDEKIIILEKDVNLNSYIGEGYKRIDISPAEIRIADSLASAHVFNAAKIDTYFDYYRQYAGYKQGSPQRIVYINAFKRKSDGGSADLLRKNVVSFKGGGSNFFQIKINLETNSCFDFGINAPK